MGLWKIQVGSEAPQLSSKLSLAGDRSRPDVFRSRCHLPLPLSPPPQHVYCTDFFMARCWSEEENKTHCCYIVGSYWPTEETTMKPVTHAILQFVLRRTVRCQKAVEQDNRN